MMNPEYKQKWIEALRSGEFEQTTKELRNSKGYCCLGVLTEIVDGKDGWLKVEHCGYYTNKDGGAGYLSDEVGEIVGLSNEEQQELANLNDNKDFSFTDIAAWVEYSL